MDTQVKAVAGLSREQVVEVLVWMIKADNEMAAAMTAEQYANELGMSFIEYLQFNKEVFTAAELPNEIARADFAITLGQYLLGAGYPEEAASRSTAAAGQHWIDFFIAYNAAPVIVRVASSETLDIGIPGFYFVKP